MIVGNGAAALSGLEAFRAHDRASRVTILSAESVGAYSRVLLPYYLRGRLPYESTFIRGGGYYRAHGAELRLGARVRRVDLSRRTLELEDAPSVPFDRLLLACGSSPSRPSIAGLDGPRVSHLWTLDDARFLDRALRPGSRTLVLGAGFVALQAAWAAHRRGVQVTVVEIVDQVLPRVLDRPAALALRERVEAHGVLVHTGTRVEGLEHTHDGRLQVDAAGLATFDADLVITATGVRPNTDILPEAVDGDLPGFAVDSALRVCADEGIYAAGDVARGPVCGGDDPQVHALWPTAVEQGAVAGANLAGAGLRYRGSLSMNVTEMFGLTVASLGRVIEVAGDDVDVRLDLPGIRYFKLVTRDRVPRGAVALGGPAAASLLGCLRPIVRQGAALDDIEALLDGSLLARRLFEGGAARARGVRALYPWPGAQSLRNEAACAS